MRSKSGGAICTDTTIRLYLRSVKSRARRSTRLLRGYVRGGGIGRARSGRLPVTRARGAGERKASALARLSGGAPGLAMHTSHAPESFRGRLLRHHSRTGLTQRNLAARAGVSLRSLQEWEAGDKFPTAERLQALMHALVEAGGQQRRGRDGQAVGRRERSAPGDAPGAHRRGLGL